ncbi:MAG: sulfate transporter, periplasmic sulfate-binding protein [Rhodospirillales bacterium]|nr:sulfate transporter, periplasmic sulfate-binding protein [Rhodospirillales bacterium]
MRWPVDSYIVVMDGDLQHYERLLPRMLEALKNDNEIAVGSSFVPGGDVGEFATNRIKIRKMGTQRGVGEVLLAWENEAFLAIKEAAADQFEIVVPAESVLAQPSVAVVDSVVDRKGTRKVAEAYLNYLYSDAGQDLAAKWFYRPRSEAVAARYARQFPAVKLFTVPEKFGSWAQAKATHFADGGMFDQIYRPGAQ